MSSSEIAVRVTGLSKCYELYDTPRDRLKQFIYPTLQGMFGLKTKQYFREFWALKDVSFEVKKGETIGIIGRNGSGKSTLLQVICGTLTATNGSVETNGRVAALLELGSGFNPEFTGRENVYLNATILGLSKEDVDKRFDDIAAFADIGEFIAQPIKTYSSGMVMRLAFAVIAHVDADILVIDEALAVGDALFLQKCMRFMRSFMENGTVLFVSHDNASVKNLCSRAIWLEKNQVMIEGDPQDICNRYLQYTLQGTYGDDIKLDDISKAENQQEVTPSGTATVKPLPVYYGAKASAINNLAMATGWKTGAAEVISFSMNKVENSLATEFEAGDRVRVIMHAKAHSALSSPILGFIVKDRLGQELFGENTIPVTYGKQCSVLAGQEFKAEFVFTLPMLQDGQYVVMSSLANGDSYNHIQHHYLHDAFIMNVYSSKIRFGIVSIPFEFVSMEIGGGTYFSSDEFLDKSISTDRSECINP